MGKELILVAEALSNEKGVSKEVVFDAIQAALESATRKLSSIDIGVRVVLDHRKGDYETFRYWDVVADDELEFPDRQLTIEQAEEKKSNAALGDHIKKPIKSI